MKIFVKILKITCITIICVIVVLFAVSLYFQDEVADMVLTTVQDKITTKYSYSDVSLSLINKFPKASLNLKNVVVKSSPNFDRDASMGKNTDTLMKAGSLSVEFSIFNLSRKKYIIESISAKDGYINLLSDAKGNVNYEIITAKKSGRETNINLEKISLLNIDAAYTNTATNFFIAGKINRGILKSTFSHKTVDFTANASLTVNTFIFNYININNDTEATLSTSLHSSEKGILFDKSSIRFNRNLLSISGSLSKEKDLDLHFSGKHLNIAYLKDYLPPKYLEKFRDYSPCGFLNVDGSLIGMLNRTTTPHISIDFLLENGIIKNEGHERAQKIDHLFVKGSFSNGQRMQPETSSFKIHDIKGSIGSYLFRGALNMTNFDVPNISVFLSGHGDAQEIAGFFPKKYVDHIYGMLDVKFRAKGTFNRDDKYKITDLFDFSPCLEVSVDSFGIGFSGQKNGFGNMCGHLSVDNDIVADHFSFKYKEQTFKINGTFANMPRRLAGEDVTVKAKADLTCDHLFPESFIKKPHKKEKQMTDTDLFFPQDWFVDLTFDIGNFVFKHYRANGLKGSFSYKPDMAAVKSITMNTLDGFIDGQGFLARNRNKSFMSGGSFQLKDLNINKTFTAFHNFGQDFIKDEHLRGSISGDFSFVLPMDSVFKIDPKTISAEGNYVITDGALIDFNPIKQLSRFTKLSELENIKFDTLANKLIIRNNYLYIPQMDIKSSVADLSINGKHGFDNKYEYHLQVLLSDLLSKKYKKPKNTDPAFASIEDDGLGRTSIMLAVTPDGVKYDMKAVRSKIKTELKKEKRTLKTILKEEYGWFKNDTVSQQTEDKKETSAASAPRFKLTWEETDDEERKEEDNKPAIGNRRKKKR